MDRGEADATSGFSVLTAHSKAVIPVFPGNHGKKEKAGMKPAFLHAQNFRVDRPDQNVYCPDTASTLP